MFKKILVPVDLTETQHQAVEVAARLAAQSGGEVTLLHVIELIHGLPLEEEKEFYQRLARKAQILLDRLLQGIQEYQSRGRVELLFGDRTREILRFTVQSETDLIVLRSHQLDPANPEIGWGTLSYKIGILAPCPVLLVK